MVTDWAPGHCSGGTPPEHTNETVTSLLFQPAALDAGLTLARIASGASCTVSVRLVEAVFPATSVAVPLKTWPVPTIVRLTGCGQLAIPESASVQLNVMVAGAVTMPLASAAGVTVAVMIGGVSSMLTVRLVLAVCAEASVTVPFTIWFAPSAVRVCDAGQFSGGTPPAHRNETVTLVLFQPAAFAAGAALAEMVSGVSCTLSVTLVEAVFPALSVAVPLNVCPAPALVRVIGDEQLAVPDSASLQTNVMTAGAVITPPAPGAGTTVAVMAVRSPRPRRMSSI